MNSNKSILKKILNELTILCLAIILSMSGCSKSSTGPDSEYRITIQIVHNGNLHETHTITEEDDGKTINLFWEEKQIGTIEINTIENFVDPDETFTSFLVFARKHSSFSIIKGILDTDTLQIDYQNDFEAYPLNKNSGTLYDMDLGAIENVTFQIFQDTLFADSLTTGENGEFVIELEPNNYLFEANGFSNYIQIQEGYNEYPILFHDSIEKPNIYLYPEKEIILDVDINILGSGRVTKSIPEFPQQWKI